MQNMYHMNSIGFGQDYRVRQTCIWLYLELQIGLSNLLGDNPTWTEIIGVLFYVTSLIFQASKDILLLSQFLTIGSYLV